MPTIASISTRTTSLLASTQLQGNLRTTQAQLLRMQQEISTGKSVIRPSDAAAKASSILYLQQQLSSRGQWMQNLDHASGVLNNADAALGEALELGRQATTVASSQIGVGSDAQTRKTEATVIQSQIDALLAVANRQHNGLSLFGGNAGAENGGVVFESFMGGVRYRGSAQNLRGDVGAQSPEAFTSNGVDAFGSLSARVATDVDLNVQASPATRLADVAGATDDGVRKGTLEVIVNGTAVAVDLATADTLADVATRINDAIASVDPAAGSLAVAGEGFALTANAGNTITIAEVGAGRTAGDLGIALTAASATVAGSSVQPRLTMATRLADLGTSVDWASGLSITQGGTTKTLDFSAATTVQDLVNATEDLGFGLRLKINDAATGLDMVSEVSGVRLSIGENGGTTAQDLGLRTFGTTTKLSDFRDGLGIEQIEGEDDFEITLHDGTRFAVDIDGVTDVAGVIAAINASAAAAGVAVGSDFAAGLAASGNGFVFTDNTAGPSDFRVANVGLSLAADHLGIRKNAGAATTLAGDDQATVRVENIFTHLIDLRDSLVNDDTAGITLAASRIESDLDGLTRARAQVGVQAKRVEQQQQRADDQITTEKSMLSDLQDADLTQVITRFTQLQQQLQASLQVGAQNMQLSLLDFLR